ncbi:MGMT family protein [Streptomyces sp. MST-110588]|nr:MGMT family protein [Streptomyces sp. MST-110588]
MSGSGQGAQNGPGEAGELPEYADRVLAVVELIPPGRVMTYGDIAEWLGEGGPRQVGRVLALYGGAVPWWRVVRADGTLLPGSELRALAHYREEGTPLKEAPRSAEDHIPRLAMAAARWDGGGEPGPGAGADPQGECQECDERLPRPGGPAGGHRGEGRPGGGEPRRDLGGSPCDPGGSGRGRAGARRGGAGRGGGPVRGSGGEAPHI